MRSFGMSESTHATGHGPPAPPSQALLRVFFRIITSIAFPLHERLHNSKESTAYLTSKSAHRVTFGFDQSSGQHSMPVGCTAPCNNQQLWMSDTGQQLTLIGKPRRKMPGGQPAVQDPLSASESSTTGSSARRHVTCELLTPAHTGSTGVP